MAVQKSKIKTKTSVYLTVIISMAVFLISSLPIWAQVTNTNGNANTNTNLDQNSNTNSNTNSSVASEPLIGDVTSEITAKKNQIDALNQQAQVYEQNIAAKQKEKASLNSQLYLLNNQISLANVDISKKQTEIEELQLEIDKTQSEIDAKKLEISKQKEQISEFIRIMYKNNQTSYLEVVLQNDSFSDFFNQLKYINDVESQIKTDLDNFLALKHDLEVKQEDLTGEKTSVNDAKQVLVQQKNTLGEQVDYQGVLLEQTQNSEDEYQALLNDLKKQTEAAQADISALEKRMRAKLAAENGQTYYGEFSGTFIWPLDSHLVTCGFHCEGYPFAKWLGPHPAMDIAASQGSPVYAASDGYVAIARKLDWTTDSRGRKIPAYNYVSLIHNETLSTVYGHLSQIKVSEGDFVTKGQVIALSGGLPGTAGAGVFSTGAHLHFEVRKVNDNGIPIPVDPAQYLP